MSKDSVSPEDNKCKKIRVLLVHQHTIVREGLRLLLEQCNSVTVVGEAETCEEASKILAKARVDIVLLDIDLRQLNSIDALSCLITASPHSRLLILTGVNDPKLCQRAIKVGADGLFLKDQTFDVLVKAIKKVMEGEVWLDRSLMAAVLLNLTRGALVDDVEKDKIKTLTPREKEIVELVSEGLRNQEIADRLFIAEKTVRNHMASIFCKLDVAHRLELAVYANKHKLATPEDSAPLPSARPK